MKACYWNEYFWSNLLWGFCHRSVTLLNSVLIFLLLWGKSVFAPHWGGWRVRATAAGIRTTQWKQWKYFIISWLVSWRWNACCPDTDHRLWQVTEHSVTPAPVAGQALITNTMSSTLMWWTSDRYVNRLVGISIKKLLTQQILEVWRAFKVQCVIFHDI